MPGNLEGRILYAIHYEPFPPSKNSTTLFCSFIKPNKLPAIRMVFPTFNPPQLRNFALPASSPFASLNNAISTEVPQRSSLIIRMFHNLRQYVSRQLSAPKSPPTRRPTLAKALHSTRPIPPASLVTQPFDASGSTLPPGLRTPNPKERDSDADTDEEPLKEVNDTTKPTCSLNLVSYRDGCAVHQITVVSQERFGGQTPGYGTTISQNPGLIKTDEELFLALRRVYFHDMCGFWRRWFSLKTLRRLRLLSVCLSLDIIVAFESEPG
jgi:hypothetical protein